MSKEKSLFRSMQKYKPGDVYEHDADPVQYDAAPSAAPAESG